MKTILFTILFSVLVFSVGAEKPSAACTLKGIRLYGKVQVVTFHEDLKVRTVPVGEDLKIRYVSFNPHECGQWQKVGVFPDFKIKYVPVGEDLKIREVPVGEGLN